jgi:phosphoribosylformylglycinamidine synthase II
MIKYESWDTFDFSNLSDEEIKAVLSEQNIPLSIAETKTVQNEFLKRPPTLAELVLFSIQGSEHSSYKSSKEHIKHFITDGPDVILGAKDDAGIVAIATDRDNNRYGLVISHESHNHPSQIVPYEGAATGIGGNVRDVCCMGAEVVAVGDGLRFGDLNNNKTKWIHEGVVGGIAGYGNPLGIPNICGDLYYDEGYNDNCLVTVIAAGIVREKDVIRSKAPKNSEGYDLILIGKPTDNSGFGGASFASLELEEEKKQQNKGAVQEPNAFLERHILKSTYELFKYLQDNNMTDKVGFKDLGAGGVACASIELADAAGMGAEVWADKIHTSMDDLQSHVTLCSETQERFMWVCHPNTTPLILDHYNKKFDFPNVSSLAQAGVVGKIIKDRHYTVYANNKKIIDGPIEQINEGFVYKRPLQEVKTIKQFYPLPPIKDYNNIILELLGHENISSKLPIYECYDKQVQGRVVLERGLSEAGVVAPFNNDSFPEEIRSSGFAAAIAHNPKLGKIDPYLAAQHAVLESTAKVVASGAIPVALTDCLCFGNPERPEQMWQFAQSCRAIRDCCDELHFGKNTNLPIIAGNVSFYNQSGENAIPSSPMIGCFGKNLNTKNAIKNSFQSSGSTVFVLGAKNKQLGGSMVADILKIKNNDVCRFSNKDYSALLGGVFSLGEKNLILSSRVVTRGGLAISLCKMSFHNNVGIDAKIDEEAFDITLFNENLAIIIEVNNKNVAEAQKILETNNIPFDIIGATSSKETIIVNNKVNLSIKEAKNVWDISLREKLLS